MTPDTMYLLKDVLRTKQCISLLFRLSMECLIIPFLRTMWLDLVVRT
jgi:hypothetical protein